jgi:hypothetical protein
VILANADAPLPRIHDGKKVVRVYDYVDAHVPMLAAGLDYRRYVKPDPELYRRPKSTC